MHRRPFGFRLAFNDYDNANDNANLGAHLCINNGGAYPGSCQKINAQFRRVLVAKANVTYKTQANEKNG